uniref:PPUP8245 n=1 Tax=Poeciliopsis prolifica TaxID=188132 RepID=A0A0S7EL97_9TELE
MKVYVQKSGIVSLISLSLPLRVLQLMTRARKVEHVLRLCFIELRRGTSADSAGFNAAVMLCLCRIVKRFTSIPKVPTEAQKRVCPYTVLSYIKDKTVSYLLTTYY